MKFVVNQCCWGARSLLLETRRSACSTCDPLEAYCNERRFVPKLDLLWSCHQVTSNHLTLGFGLFTLAFIPSVIKVDLHWWANKSTEKLFYTGSGYVSSYMNVYLKTLQVVSVTPVLKLCISTNERATRGEYY